MAQISAVLLYFCVLSLWRWCGDTQMKRILRQLRRMSEQTESQIGVDFGSLAQFLRVLAVEVRLGYADKGVIVALSAYMSQTGSFILADLGNLAQFLRETREDECNGSESTAEGTA